MRAILVTAFGLAVAPLAALAGQQGPPDSLINTQVIPRDTPVPVVIAQMRDITRALGVRCTYCHVGDESMNIWAYDFVSDEKVAKQKARVMLRMVRAINAEHLSQLGALDAQGLEVTCETCHRGVTLPIPLRDVLIRAHADSGYAGMTATYATMRDRYYGSAAYDFGEQTLEDVGTTLARRDAMQDAVRTYVMNAELFASSPLALGRAGLAHVTAGDTTTGIQWLRRALELDPDNSFILRSLGALGIKP